MSTATGATTSGASTVVRPSSPATPKRSRKDLGLTDDTTFDDDDISPIASPKHNVSPRTTPKRRRSHAPGGRSLLDLFSTVREDTECRRQPVVQQLAMSVDFSNMGSLTRVQASAMVEDVESPHHPSTPPSSRTRLLTPGAPRKCPRSVVSRSCPNLVLREEEEISPSPRRLDFGQTTSEQESRDDDYGAIMSIVGYVSSFITRTGSYDVSVSELASMLQTASNNFKTRESATTVLHGLARCCPQWVRSDNGMFHFETTTRSFDVLSQLRVLKRDQIMKINLGL